MNASLAIQSVTLALKHFSQPSSSITFDDINVRWPGRCEIIQSPKLLPGIRLFIDGAHTSESVEVAIRWWNETSKPHRTASNSYLLFSCSEDRNEKYNLSDAVLQHSEASFSRIFNVDNEQLRGLQYNKDLLKKSVENHSIPQFKDDIYCHIFDVAHILPILKFNLPEGSNLLVIGSLFLVGAVFEILDISTTGCNTYSA